MPKDKPHQPSRTADDGRDARRLIADLRQPLAAASNYIGTVRTILSSHSGPEIAAALEMLDKAEGQVLRAGDMLRELRGHLADRQ